MDDLDRLLAMRRDVPVRAGLEGRILMATQPPMMAFILLPRPIFMMVFLLVFGLGLGLYGADFSDFSVDYADLLLEEDNLGDFI